MPFIISASTNGTIYYYGMPCEYMAGSGRASKASRKLATIFVSRDEAESVADSVRKHLPWSIEVEEI